MADSTNPFKEQFWITMFQWSSFTFALICVSGLIHTTTPIPMFDILVLDFLFAILVVIFYLQFLLRVTMVRLCRIGEALNDVLNKVK